MIKQVHNHSYDIDILQPSGWVLDLGCNDFIFSRHMLDLGMRVIGLDPIKDLSVPILGPNFHFMNMACVGNPTSHKVYYEYSSWGANSLYNPPEMLLNRKENAGHANNPFKTSYNVECITISEIMKKFNITQFDFIKIDIEGAEYEIINNFDQNCTKQMSIEFHDFLGLNPSQDIELYHKHIIENQLNEFTVAYEDKEPLYGITNGVFQRNDVLYINKKYIRK